MTYKFNPVSFRSIVKGVDMIPSRWLNNSLFLYRMTPATPISGCKHGWAAVIVDNYGDGRNTFEGRFLLQPDPKSVNSLFVPHVADIKSLYVPNLTSRYVQTSTDQVVYVRRTGTHQFGKGVPTRQLFAQVPHITKKTNEVVSLKLTSLNIETVLSNMLIDMGHRFEFKSEPTPKVKMNFPPQPSDPFVPVDWEAMRAGRPPSPRVQLTRHGDIADGIPLPPGIPITTTLVDTASQVAREHRARGFILPSVWSLVNEPVDVQERVRAMGEEVRSRDADRNQLDNATRPQTFEEYLNSLNLSPALRAAAARAARAINNGDITEYYKGPTTNTEDTYRTLTYHRVSNDYCIARDVETQEAFVLYREVLVGTLSDGNYNFNPDFSFLEESFKTCLLA